MRSSALLVCVALVAAPVATAASASPACRRSWRGRELVAPSPSTPEQLAELASFPATLDWCAQGLCTASWSQQLGPQGCGECFAPGALSAAQDRLKILRRQRGELGPDVQLSRQSFLNCAHGVGLSQGCGGGEPLDVFEFMARFGLPDETCQAFRGFDHVQFLASGGTCPPEAYCMSCAPGEDGEAACRPVSKVARYRATAFGRVAGEHAIMKELLHGPVTCGLANSAELRQRYSGGVFEDATGSAAIDHDVEVVGWGETAEGVKYWRARSSWGSFWGDDGFFRIARGSNNLGIESDCFFVRVDSSEEEVAFAESAVDGVSRWSIVPFSDVEVDAGDDDHLDRTPSVEFAKLPRTPSAELDLAKLPRTPSAELDLAALPRTPSAELDLAKLPRTPSAELDLAKLPRTPSAELDLAKLPRTPSAELDLAKLPRTPSAELDLAKLPRTPSAELDLAALPRTPSAELDLAKLPRTPSAELDLAALPRTPSAELDLASLPRTPSAELDLAKLPRTPSAELDLAALPRTPSAELDLAKLPRTPSAELDLAALPRTPSAELDLAALPRTPSAELDLAALPRTPSAELDTTQLLRTPSVEMNAKLPRTPSVALPEEALTLSARVGSAHWLVGLVAALSAFGAAVGIFVARAMRRYTYEPIR